MQLSPESPRLPKLPFLLGDAVLLAAIGLVYAFGNQGLLKGAMQAIGDFKFKKGNVAIYFNSDWLFGASNMS